MAKPKFEISVQIPGELGAQFTKSELAALRKSFNADVALVLESKLSSSPSPPDFV